MRRASVTHPCAPATPAPPPTSTSSPTPTNGMRTVLPEDGAGDKGNNVREFRHHPDRKSTRLNSSHLVISYAVFCLKKKKKKKKKNKKTQKQKQKKKQQTIINNITITDTALKSPPPNMS